MEVLGKDSRTVSLYAAQVGVLEDPAVYEAALAAVSEQRREKSARLKFADDRRLGVGAELLLLYALKKRGSLLSQPEFAAEDNGKPYLAGADSLFFNLSHSGEYVLAAVSQTPVGCDIEKYRPGILRLAKRIFLPQEYEDIVSQESTAKQEERFFYYWTLKESFMKVTGLGLRLPPSDFSFDAADGRIEIRQSVNGKSYSFRNYSDIPGYGVSLASEESDISGTMLQVISMEEVLEETVL